MEQERTCDGKRDGSGTGAGWLHAMVLLAALTWGGCAEGPNATPAAANAAFPAQTRPTSGSARARIMDWFPAPRWPTDVFRRFETIDATMHRCPNPRDVRAVIVTWVRATTGDKHRAELFRVSRRDASWIQPLTDTGTIVVGEDARWAPLEQCARELLVARVQQRNSADIVSLFLFDGDGWSKGSWIGIGAIELAVQDRDGRLHLQEPMDQAFRNLLLVMDDLLPKPFADDRWEALKEIFSESWRSTTRK